MSEKHITFKKWQADHHNVRSVILASMSNNIQKQYDRLDDVDSIVQRMKEVYAIVDRHTRYVTTKEFFRTKITERSSVQEYKFKKLSLVEKLEDLKVGLDNVTYIDVILQSLSRSFYPFIVNFNMNWLEKSINELINMLVKGKRVGRWKRKKANEKVRVNVAAKNVNSTPVAPKGMGKGKRKVGPQQQSRANNLRPLLCERALKEGLSQTPSQVLERSKKDEVVLRLGDGKAIAVEAVESVKYDWIMTAQNNHKLDNFENT
ncbi:UNVERIFIED_CONTAM: hypothetical protein Slati_3061300 [Sesamum latifolium]|uniref:Uncharacterized protein n=1 Tax=Sesamum latifolium TaxID=2727402 RepID=A0AAW2UT39_9LAMI